ncbi:MAG: hypothetical protein RL172_2928 [Bacteroidota bacterium]|jgi:hypothetical protein
MNLYKKILLCLLSVCTSAGVWAQSASPEMADTMRSNGKIYIVVAVCLTLLIGLFFYVFLVDKKISKLEKQSGN